MPLLRQKAGFSMSNMTDNYISLCLDRWAETQPNKPAVISEGNTITYRELYEKSLAFAAALRRRGLREKDTAVLFMGSGIPYTVCFFACIALGLTVVPVNDTCRSEELRQVLALVRPKLAVVESSEKDAMLYSLDETLDVLQLHNELLPFLAPADNGRFDGAASENACILLSTSGSTGKLKFVMNSFRNELLNASLYTGRMEVTQEDVVLTGLPETQKFGMAALLGALTRGCTAVIPTSFRAEHTLRLIHDHRVSVQYGVPTMYIRQRDAYLAAEEKPVISSLRTGIIAGAPVGESLLQWFEQTAGCYLLNCYGTSEIGGLTMTCLDDPAEVRYTTCGRLFDGAALAISTDGEITAKVPWAMAGYAGEPEMTKNAFNEDGYFLTGDIGSMDEDGNLHINGRRKNMILRGGYNVFPAEVELALVHHGGVTEACVVGFHDEALGERICAFVKGGEETPRDLSRLRALLAPHIAKHKLPDRVVFMAELPKLPGGKIDIPALKKLLET